MITPDQTISTVWHHTTIIPSHIIVPVKVDPLTILPDKSIILSLQPQVFKDTKQWFAFHLMIVQIVEEFAHLLYTSF